MILSINNNFNIQEVERLLIEAFSNMHPDDVAKFAIEQKQALGDWFDTARLEKYSHEGDGTMVEARNEDGELAGLAYVGKENVLMWPDGNKVELYLLAVKPKYRGRGLGQALINKAETIGREMGAKMIVVHTNTKLDADIKLYQEKARYEQLGILKDFYANGDAIFFGKKLP